MRTHHTDYAQQALRERPSTAEEVIEALSQAPEVGSMKTHTEYARQAIREREYLEEIERERELDRLAVAKFNEYYADRRPGMRFTFWGFTVFLCKIAAISVAVWALLVVAMLASM